MISENTINQNKNYFVSYTKTFTDFTTTAESGIDTEVNNLSSRKLWQILQLNQIKGCELDQQFIDDVKNELVARNDFNEGKAWQEPH